MLCVLKFGISQQQSLNSPKPVGTRLLLIEAQDLGMAHSVDKASFESIEKGWVTSLGILVPGPWFPEVVRWSRIHPDLEIGVQLDLNSEWASYRWRSTSQQPRTSGLVDPAGYLPNSAGFIAQHAKPEEVAAEFRDQVENAREAGLNASYIDSHGGIALFTPWLFQEFWKTSQSSKLAPVISKDYVLQRGIPTADKNVYELGGCKIDISKVLIDRIIQMEPGIDRKDWLSAYERVLGALPPGAYLLIVHLGFNDDELQAMTIDHPYWGAQWRQNDYDVISNPEFHQFLKDNGFLLVTWKDLQNQTANHN